MILKTVKAYKTHIHPTTLFLFLIFSFFISHISVPLYSENTTLHAENTLNTLVLRDNLKKAKTGDFLATLQNKTFTLFHISKATENSLLIEEISIPKPTFLKQKTTFRNWFENGAKESCSWIMYEVDLRSGQILKSYLFTNNQWYEKSISNPFLSTLLNIPLIEVPASERKKTGLLGSNALWNPSLKFDGQAIQNVPFHAWRTKWPNDGSDLSGKVIEIYTPEDSDLYPSYLPYWLEIKGSALGAKIRIIDSGRNLNSKHPL